MRQEPDEPSSRLDLVQAQCLDELAQLRSLPFDDLQVGTIAATIAVSRGVRHGGVLQS